MFNEKRFGLYQIDVENKLEAIISRFLQADVEELEFVFDLSLPSGANQYLVRTKVQGAQRFFLARLSTTYEFAGQACLNIQEDVDEVEVENWPPLKVRIRNSTYVLKFKM